MTHEEIWQVHFQDFAEFMRKHQRRPSKHRLEEHRLLNWFKYAKKQMGKGKLTEEQQNAFKWLLTFADEVRRKNQYAYYGKRGVAYELTFLQ